MDNVVALDLSAARAQQVIKEIADEHSERVVYTAHAKTQMRKRRITRVQVLRCLRHGQITEGPARSANGNWQFTIESYSAGTPVAVAAALDHDRNGNLIVVITTY
ncbi:MAG: DUF4258 domain-containing protein [Sedimenticola sp.]